MHLVLGMPIADGEANDSTPQPGDSSMPTSKHVSARATVSAPSTKVVWTVA